jgi:proline racemase
VLDRSSCGTGTSARLAPLRARGETGPDAECVDESFVGGGIAGEATVSATETGTRSAIVPTVTGRPRVTGVARYLLDPYVTRSIPT